MNKRLFHSILGSAVCLSTMLLYLAFFNRLPAMVPVHWDLHGNVNNYISKSALVFGFPIGSLIINCVADLQMKDTENWFKYYIFPLISVLAAVLIIALGIK